MPITGPDMKRLRTKMFSLPGGSTFPRLLKTLSRTFVVEESASTVENRTYYDTFDWRLHRSSQVFFFSGSTLSLRRFNGRKIADAAGRKRAKYFWWDLGTEESRNHLRDVIEMRALCPIIEVSTGFSNFRIMNRDRKTVARLELRTDQADGIDGDVGELITVYEIRGYENEFETIAQNCLDRKCIVFKKKNLIHRLLENSARSPRDYGAKFKVDLDPEITIGKAVAQICLHLVGDMKRNHGGVIDDIDSEFLHDFRIAVRRTRSLLSLMKQVLPAQSCSYFQKEFRWLGMVTGPLRDIDVYLLEKEAYLDLLPVSLQAGMNTFFEQVEARRAGELKDLKAELGSNRYEQLIVAWCNFLKKPDSGLFSDTGAQRCRDFSDKMILKRFNSFIRGGNRIEPGSPADDLHKLRIKGKKFRYLLEFFKSFYDQGQMGLFLKHMKKLQDNLGTFNDLSVQQNMLGTKLDLLRGKNLQTIRFAAALGGLIAVLAAKHRGVRSEFESTYAEFARPQVRSILQAMVNGEIQVQRHDR